MGVDGEALIKVGEGSRCEVFHHAWAGRGREDAKGCGMHWARGSMITVVGGNL